MANDTDTTTIRVSKAAHREARERKERAGQEWEEYLLDENRGRPDPEAVAAELAEHLAPVTTAEREDMATAMNAVEEADDADDADDCPECGGTLVHYLGRETRTCADCGTTVAHDND
jgi:hypothetical protein